MQKIIITLNETNTKEFTMDVDFDPQIGTKEEFFGNDHASKRLQIVAGAIYQVITQKMPEIAQQVGQIE